MEITATSSMTADTNRFLSSNKQKLFFSKKESYGTITITDQVFDFSPVESSTHPHEKFLKDLKADCLIFQNCVIIGALNLENCTVGSLIRFAHCIFKRSDPQQSHPRGCPESLKIWSSFMGNLHIEHCIFPDGLILSNIECGTVLLERIICSQIRIQLRNPKETSLTIKDFCGEKIHFLHYPGCCKELRVSHAVFPKIVGDKRNHTIIE